MKEWFLSLNARERLIVAGGAIVLAILLIYSLTWAPLNRTLGSLRTHVQSQQEQLTWMREASQEVRALQRTQPRRIQTGNKSLLSLVDQSATQAGLKSSLQRMDPEGDDGLKLQLSDVSFDRLILWLGDLEKKFGISVSSLALTHAQKPGHVEARLTLERPST